uniref:Uncharacterized protein n=1 Tax=Arundo donax TaxID=35708 RepID=A0A0A8ZRY6_ARUDO
MNNGLKADQKAVFLSILQLYHVCNQRSLLQAGFLEDYG